MGSHSIKIDAYAHIVTPQFRAAVQKVSPRSSVDLYPAAYDLEYRFRIMDRYEPLVQVLTLWPWPPDVACSEHAVDLAKMGNDEMAELVFRYPDRFVAAVACLPLNNIDAALKEADRAIRDLRFRGVLLHTPLNDRPLDSPELMPLYEMMGKYNLPVFIHPVRGADYPDYRTEKESKYCINSLFGWIYETTTAMTRLVYSGILERYPNLKFVTHHCGAMVPYLEQRIIMFGDVHEMRNGFRYRQALTRAPIQYFKLFYNDTAIYGNTAALMCAHAFCGPEKLLFACDMPYGDTEMGNRNYRQTIRAIEQMAIGDREKKMIFEDNARNLMNLPI
jgi:predicted TIM-barrel fold metal-dependent hydrolase